MKKNIRSRILLGILLCLSLSLPVCAETIKVPDTNPAFTFQIFKKGQKCPTIVEGNRIIYEAASTYNLNSNEVLSIRKAGEYWSKILKKAGNKPATFSISTYNGDGANASSEDIIIKNEPYLRTWVNAQYNGKTIAVKIPSGINAGKINIGSGISGMSYDNYIEPRPIPQCVNADLYVVVAHEMGHALGISSTATKNDDGYYRFDSPISVWDNGLRVENGGVVSRPSAGGIIKLDSEIPDLNTFDISKASPYFVGTNTLEALGYKAVADGLINHSLNDRIERVKGLPVLGIELGGDGTYMPELSHIELRNSYMSHQDYRNWSTFMEAELAALQDIGFTIDRKAYFGQSYYADGQILDNMNGFFARNSDGTAYTSDFSFTEYGIGVHIYGDNNTITQKADILTKGDAAVGARIEGVNNKFVLNSGNKIKADGLNGVGVLASWGSGHTITLKSGAEVSALGSGGIGVSFDFGKNILGEKSAHQGSYINFVAGQDIDEVILPAGLNGALIKNFNVSSTLQGKKAAINIADTAYVENINIMRGSDIKGNIVSNWNSETSGFYKFKVQNPTSLTLMTNLNYGLTANANGDVSTSVDSSFTSNYSDNISGKDTLVLNVKGGTLNYDKGKANIYSLNVDNGAKLVGSAKYDLTNSFVNKGTYTTKDVVDFKAAGVDNEGTINIGGVLNLDSNINTPLLGTIGTVNLGYTDGGSVDGILNLSKNTATINNNLNIQSDSLLSSMNSYIQNVEIKNYNAKTGSLISFDLGDVFILNATSGDKKSTIGQIKVDEATLNKIKNGQSEFNLLSGDGVLTLEGGSNIYSGGKKYSIQQNGKNLIVEQRLTRSVVPVFKLPDALADSSCANYIVTENEVQTQSGGGLLRELILKFQVRI